MILGTAAYMAPEQAKGRPVDRRPDIWAFGCVLYEMLTGRRAFNGDDISDTITAVLRDEPDWTALPSATPAHVRRVVLRCLEKDARQRMRDIGDVRLELAGAPGLTAEAASDVTAAEPARHRRGQRVVLVAASLAAGAIIRAIAGVCIRRVRASEIYVRPYPAVDGGRWQISTGGGTRPLWSRDGRELFFLDGDMRLALPSGLQLSWSRPARLRRVP